jgi:hypothetical protein
MIGPALFCLIAFERYERRVDGAVASSLYLITHRRRVTPPTGSAQWAKLGKLWRAVISGRFQPGTRLAGRYIGVSRLRMVQGFTTGSSLIAKAISDKDAITASVAWIAGRSAILSQLQNATSFTGQEWEKMMLNL